MSTETTTGARTTTVVALSPVTGTVVDLSAVPDQVFSAGILGKGAGVRPSDGDIVAPVNGEIVSAMPHAYGIRSDSGADLLVHIGLDTVELEGAHFSPTVSQGQRVRAGDRLTAVDLAAVADAGYDTVVIVVVTNSATLTDVAATTGAVTAGDTLLTITL